MWMIFYLVFTVTASLVHIVALPIMFAFSTYKVCKKRSLVPLIRPLSMAGGLVIGIAGAWFTMVFHYGWPLSLKETFHATVHSGIYYELPEDAVEDFVFFMLFLGNLGAILAGLTLWLVARSRRRVALTD